MTERMSPEEFEALGGNRIYFHSINDTIRMHAELRRARASEKALLKALDNERYAREMYERTGKP